ncbi:LuxR C-terminal-related transcriptional regulator [Erythrobacter sp. F6033]|uniref:response regulator transcription factor n=1 Tax=Erythrobacter sp. F6033 TaxID=2926401 RepID=UPI001FF2B2ED|nr:LuxR C-terminal-related transcriptional regulator [Erythrobacter sp. F6033]MCK0127804.1 LuxR C-terminal-related transcriptional regulator [Erythrobacter sp. F6033]
MTRKATLHFIDSSSRNRAELARAGFSLGHHSEVYGDLSELSSHPPREGIIVARDTVEEGGVAMILERLSRLGIWLPLIAVEEQPRPGRIVEAIKAGALDYLSLPLDQDRFARCLTRIEKEAEIYGAARRRMIEARDRISSLSGREREVLEWLSEGSSNKVIARELDISPRTVEIHRANMMNKLGANHAAEAVRLKLEAKLEPRQDA